LKVIVAVKAVENAEGGKSEKSGKDSRPWILVAEHSKRAGREKLRANTKQE
jgi:hypothetical protein